MPTTPKRYFNPHNVKHGTLDVNTVRQVSYRKTYQRLAGQGDNDATDSFQAKVNLQVNGNLVLEDPNQADALIDAPSADLAWEGNAGLGGTNKLVTIANVEFFDLNETDAHNTLDAITLGFNSFNPDGSDPVTIGAAV